MASEFNASSTADDVVAGLDLGGKRVLITGASAGLGIEKARALASRGAHVVGAVRNIKKAEAASAPIRQAAAKGGGGFELTELDLSSLASVRAAADRLAAGAPFDIIIANAGVMNPPEETTTDGFDAQFGTNHLGHFLLINRLVPKMPAGGRVVSLASSAHHMATLTPEDLEHPEDSTPYHGYGGSKSANILFAVELDRRLKDRGIRVAAVHPGAIETELGRHMDPEKREASRARLAKAAASTGRTFKPKTVPEGAATSLWAAVRAPGEEVGGRYCEDCSVAETVPAGTKLDPLAPGVAHAAQDPERAKLLWALSEKLIGEAF